MGNENSSLVRKVIFWIIGALGTLAIALAGLWINRYLGPKDSDPCAQYTPAEKDRFYMDELNAAIKTAGAKSPEAIAVVKVLSLEYHLAKWVASCGKLGGAYERELPDSALGFSKVRIEPYNVYKDASGTECRQLSFARKVGDEWRRDNKLYCQVDGKWWLDATQK